MRVLLAVLMLSSLLLASKIVSSDVSNRTESADLLLRFDTPYTGSVRKSRQNNTIIIKFAGVQIDASTAEKITSPYLSRLTILPFEKETKIIVEVPESVTVRASKTADALRLRLRFSKRTTSQIAAASNVAVYPGTLTGGYVRSDIMAVFGGVITLLLFLLWRKRKKGKAEASPDVSYRSRDEAKRNSMMLIRLKTMLNPRRKRKIKQEAVLPKAEAADTEKGKSDVMPNRFEKLLNPKSKVLMLIASLTVIVLLLPKINVYYQLEQVIEPYEVVFNDEQLDDRGLWLNIKNTTLYFKEIESAQIENSDIMLFGLYNRITFENISLAETFKQFVPVNIEYIKAIYSVADPMHIQLEAVGEFGSAEARVAVFDRNISVTLQPSELMKRRFQPMLNKLEKDETGAYHYVSRF